MCAIFCRSIERPLFRGLHFLTGNYLAGRKCLVLLNGGAEATKKPSKLAGLFIEAKVPNQDLGGVLSGLGIFGPDLPRMPLRGACCSSKIFCCSGVSKA